jgi:hypothetical protein
VSRRRWGVGGARRRTTSRRWSEIGSAVAEWGWVGKEMGNGVDGADCGGEGVLVSWAFRYRKKH